jgi:hypothetical protein
LVHVQDETPVAITTTDNDAHKSHEVGRLAFNFGWRGRCDVCVPIRYEKEWACKKRFTQLQRAVKLFSRNSGDKNDALNTTVNVLTSIPCSRFSKM